MTYKRFDVVRVPFPFTDKLASKNRPALILSVDESFQRHTGHSVMAMITSSKHSPWALDVPLTDLEAVGLKSPSLVRFKLFTLDHTLIRGTLGHLSPTDQVAVSEALSELFTEAT